MAKLGREHAPAGAWSGWVRFTGSRGSSRCSTTGPLLALILITLDVVVLYALTVRWDEARLGGL